MPATKGPTRPIFAYEYRSAPHPCHPLKRRPAAEPTPTAEIGASRRQGVFRAPAADERPRYRAPRRAMPDTTGENYVTDRDRRRQPIDVDQVQAGIPRARRSSAAPQSAGIVNSSKPAGRNHRPRERPTSAPAPLGAAPRTSGLYVQNWTCSGTPRFAPRPYKRRYAALLVRRADRLKQRQPPAVEASSRRASVPSAPGRAKAAVQRADLLPAPYGLRPTALALSRPVATGPG